MDFETTFKVELTTAKNIGFSEYDAEILMEVIQEGLYDAVREAKLPLTYKMFKVVPA